MIPRVTARYLFRRAYAAAPARSNQLARMKMATPNSIVDALDAPGGSPQTAVQSINNAIISSEAKKEDLVYDLWSRLLVVAGKTPPGEQGRLVEFLDTLRKSPIKNASGEDIAVGGGTLWTRLPTFGWVVRDMWNFDIHDPKATPEMHEDWDNKTAFLAHLTSKADPADEKDPFDYSLYALWAMRDAFETDPPNGVDNGPAVRNAALWVTIASPVLQRMSSESKEMSKNTGAAGAKFLDKGWKGFNPERWNTWKAGFMEARGSVEEAKAAGDAMERLD